MRIHSINPLNDPMRKELFVSALYTRGKMEVEMLTVSPYGHTASQAWIQDSSQLNPIPTSAPNLHSAASRLLCPHLLTKVVL